MKAVQIDQYGGPDVLKIRDVKKPSLKKGQVLIENYAASINPFDYKIRSGIYKAMIPLSLPSIIGGDFAGVIKEVGEGVTEFAVGDQVFGQAIVLNGGSGAFAEYVASNAKNTAKKPKNSNFSEAAALALVGSSAVQALEDHIKLQKGQKILIHGGAGGIGSIAIQVAKALGAYIATTVGTDDIDFAKQLGADEVIDYKTQQFEDVLKDFDAVYDTVGGETTKKSFKVLKKGGILVSMLGEPDKKLAQQFDVTGIGQMTQTNTAHLQKIAAFVDEGKVKVYIEKVFPLDHVQEAFQYQEEKHPRGKVVVEIKNNA